MIDRIEQRVLEVAKYTIETGATVRDTAKVFGSGLEGYGVKIAKGVKGERYLDTLFLLLIKILL